MTGRWAGWVAACACAVGVGESQAATVEVSPGLLTFPAAGSPQATRCYDAGSMAQVTGTGYRPGGTVTITADGKPFPDNQVPVFGSDDGATTEQAGQDGAFSLWGAMPTPRRGPVDTAKVVATDDATPAATASTTVKVVTQAVAVTGRRQPLRAVVVVHAFGFERGEKVYAHYVLRGKQHAATLLGRADAGCGERRVRTRALPVRAPRRGTWLVQYDGAAKFSKDTTPRIRRAISVGARQLRYRAIDPTRPAG